MTDSHPPPSRSRRRSLVLEGLTIVLSILLAFAIDAWWDTSRDRAADERQLQALRAELAINGARLVEILESGERALALSRELVDVIGPATELIPPDSLGRLIGGSTSMVSPGSRPRWPARSSRTVSSRTNHRASS